MYRALLRTSFVQLHAEDKNTSNYEIHEEDKKRNSYVKILFFLKQNTFFPNEILFPVFLFNSTLNISHFVLVNFLEIMPKCLKRSVLF